MRKRSVRARRETVHYLVPHVPNFINSGSGAVDVGALPVSTLRAIGRAWIDALLENAAARRIQVEEKQDALRAIRT